MHAQMGYKNTIIQRKRNTRHGSSVFGADEEQGCKTLHQHWQIWVQELNQTLRDCLFDTDAAKRKDARKTFCQHIDNVISSCYGPGLSITHKCIDGDGNE